MFGKGTSIYGNSGVSYTVLGYGMPETVTPSSNPTTTDILYSTSFCGMDRDVRLP